MIILFHVIYFMRYLYIIMFEILHIKEFIILFLDSLIHTKIRNFNLHNYF